MVVDGGRGIMSEVVQGVEQCSSGDSEIPHVPRMLSIMGSDDLKVGIYTSPVAVVVGGRDVK